MPIWDYPEPNEDEDQGYDVFGPHEHDPDFEYDERRASDLIDD